MVDWMDRRDPGVNSQGATREELLDNLCSALREAIEMNRADALARSRATFKKKASSCEATRPHRPLDARGCLLAREARKHSWWANPTNNRRSAVPRHSEISDFLIRKICRDLGIESP